MYPSEVASRTRKNVGQAWFCPSEIDWIAVVCYYCSDLMSGIGCTALTPVNTSSEKRYHCKRVEKLFWIKKMNAHVFKKNMILISWWWILLLMFLIISWKKKCFESSILCVVIVIVVARTAILFNLDWFLKLYRYH